MMIPSLHVKGHQDRQQVNKESTGGRNNSKTITSQKLTWEAKVSIRADKLATNVKEEITLNEKIQKQDLFPACDTHLIINKQAITRNIKPSIRKAWSNTNLRKEYIKRFKWKQTTYDNVDWDAVGCIFLTKEYKAHHFIVRFINQHLPLRGEKYTSMENKKCPC
eukprot:14735430-Ditylum_brightwellii.AAC.1